MTVDVKHKPLEISHHLKANDWMSMVVTAFCSSSFNYCYTWCAHNNSIVRNKSEARDLNVIFQERKKSVNQWRYVMSNKCPESNTTAMRVMWSEKKKRFGISIFISWRTADGLDLAGTAANCSTRAISLMYIKHHHSHRRHRCQYMLHYDAALPWWLWM